jgi:signal transduction histidine kinase
MSSLDFAELISKIAHELRSPLTSVKGFSATLIKRWDRFSDEQRRQFVETIHVDAERMSRIVTEVLDLARLEAGRLELNLTRVNLHAIVARATEQVARMAGSERVEVDVDEELTAWADPSRLEHIVSNLVENGIKFSDHGPVRLTAEEEDGVVTISVSDEGVGIEAERLPHVFSGPAPAGQRSAPTGTGLGLYLTKRLVEAHGGSIDVESAVDRGSTFTIRLPSAGESDGWSPDEAPE